VSECCAPNAVQDGDAFDLVVLGAGSAGFSAAITAAEQGARVALIGHGTIGGTCVNVGCVPSKTLIRATETLHQATASARFAGVRSAAGIDDWRALIAQKDALVTELRQAKYIDVLPAYNTIAYLEGAAAMRDEGRAIVVGDTTVSTERTIVATGSSAALPKIAGMASVPYLTSTTALELETLPASLLVIGGGYIGCELAQMFARAGVQVTIVCRSHLLPEVEPEISAALAEYFETEGIRVLGGANYQSIRQASTGAALSVKVGDAFEILHAERVMLAAGRQPNTEGLGLEDSGVLLTDRGAIQVNDRLQTSNPMVYAAGDVTGRDMFVYMAAYGARIAAENALNGNSRRYDSTAMPAVVFTDPQVASVGVTEAAARADGVNVRTSVLPLTHVPRALAARDTRGLIKLVANGDNDRLIGAHILAPEGADSVQTAALAIKHGMSYQELGATIFPYLTTVEGLKLAAQTFDKNVEELSCCAG
jgi:mercuric reductase